MLPIDQDSMELSHIRTFVNKHCRFKLRGGKEVFGVIWEVETSEVRKFFFASVRDYERFQRDPGQPINVIPMLPEEIVQVEGIAS